MTGTVARELRLDELLYTGKENGVIADKFPFPSRRADLERGRERYNIYCTPCHDYTPRQGNGMIVQRGFPQPPSFHVGAFSARLRLDITLTCNEGLGRCTAMRRGCGLRTLAHCSLYPGVAGEPSREYR